MYMKRILTILASVAMVMTAVSCNPEQTPSLSFGKAQYVLLADAPLTVDVVTDVAPAADLTVDLLFTGEAVVDADYTVSATSVVIPAGQAKGSVTITPFNNFEEGKNIIISMKVPTGYQIGKNATATVAVEAREELLYSFYTAKSDVVGSYRIEVEIEGMDTGDDWVAGSDMNIPYKITPVDGASLAAIAPDADYFVVKAGENSAFLTVNPGSGYDNSKFVITLDDPQFAAGNNPSMTLTVRGPLEPSKLVGTWEFQETLDLEELELWFMEYEDDPDLLPTHNEGFKLTVTQNGDTYTITPSGEGDWMNYFRPATITNTAPVNMCSNGIITGKYTSSEPQIFIQESEGIATAEMTYFELSSVNRNFDADSEELGTGVIAISFDDDDNLIIQIKDYDTPPFGEMWWELYEGYDGDMFSFASRFVKAE